MSVNCSLTNITLCQVKIYLWSNTKYMKKTNNTINTIKEEKYWQKILKVLQENTVNNSMGEKLDDFYQYSNWQQFYNLLRCFWRMVTLKKSNSIDMFLVIWCNSLCVSANGEREKKKQLNSSLERQVYCPKGWCVDLAASQNCCGADIDSIAIGQALHIGVGI